MNGPLPTANGDVVIVHTPAALPPFLVWLVREDGQQTSADNVVPAHPFLSKPEAVDFALSYVADGCRIYLLDQTTGEWALNVLMPPRVRVVADVTGAGDRFTVVVSPGPDEHGVVNSYGPMSELEVRYDLLMRGVGADAIDDAISDACATARSLRGKLS